MLLNFANVDTFAPLPDDIVYGAEVILSQPAASKKGNPTWKTRVKITEAADGGAVVLKTNPDGTTSPVGDEEVQYSTAVSRILFDDISLLPQAQFKVVEALQALGEDVKAGEDSDFDFDPSRYMGRNVGIVVENLEYQGTIRSSIKRWVNPQYVGYHLSDPALAGGVAVAD